MKLTLERYEGNPILTPTAHAWENKAVFNCGVTTFNGRILLLYRAQGDDNISRFGLAFSDDGFHIAERLSSPVFAPDPDTEYEALGVEDPRISQVGDDYYVVYTAASMYPKVFEGGIEERPTGEIPWRVRVSVAHTQDFKTFSRHGVVISHIDSKDGVLFPGKVRDNYLLIHRVVPDIRLAVAKEIHQFKERGIVLRPDGTGWDGDVVGAGAPPIHTKYGWLLLYHGIHNHVYGLGFALLDPHEPTQVLGKTDGAVLLPEKAYEKKGLVNNVVFSCGTAVKNDTLFVYYGAADCSVGVATIEFERVLDWAKAHYQRAHRA